jgi:hypothetical protein
MTGRRVYLRGSCAGLLSAFLPTHGQNKAHRIGILWVPKM